MITLTVPRDATNAETEAIAAKAAAELSAAIDRIDHGDDDQIAVSGIGRDTALLALAWLMSDDFSGTGKRLSSWSVRPDASSELIVRWRFATRYRFLPG